MSSTTSLRYSSVDHSASATGSASPRSTSPLLQRRISERERLIEAVQNKWSAALAAETHSTGTGIGGEGDGDRLGRWMSPHMPASGYRAGSSSSVHAASASSSAYAASHDVGVRASASGRSVSPRAHLEHAPRHAPSSSSALAASSTYAAAATGLRSSSSATRSAADRPPAHPVRSITGTGTGSPRSMVYTVTDGVPVPASPSLRPPYEHHHHHPHSEHAAHPALTHAQRLSPRYQAPDGYTYAPPVHEASTSYMLLPQRIHFEGIPRSITKSVTAAVAAETAALSAVSALDFGGRPASRW